MVTYNLTAVFGDDDTIQLWNVTESEIQEKLPVSLHGAIRLMMHPGDVFKFESTGEKTSWEVVRL